VLGKLTQEYFIKHLQSTGTNELSLITQLLCEKMHSVDNDVVVDLGVVCAVFGGQAWSKFLCAFKRNIDQQRAEAIHRSLRVHYYKFLGRDVV
jgi:hypothetical protein